MFRLAATVASDSYCRLLHGARRAVSGKVVTQNVRKRRAVYKKALNDPTTHPGTLRKLREGAALAPAETLQYLAETKIGKAVTQSERRALYFNLEFKKYAPLFLGQMKPSMNLWTAALEQSQLPLPRLPEVAIAGRSNSGKSTLVNYLCGRHSAKVKREPGSTTELVFWKIGRPAQLCVVDLPGYGFANAPEERRLQWTEFALWYLRSRQNLRKVLLLVNAQAGMKPSDKEMIAYLERHRVEWQIIFTKCDRVNRKDLARRLTVLEEDLSGYARMAGPPIPISALKRMGMDLLRDQLNGLKVQKSLVKEGIRTRVYDLMEEKRIKRAEKARRKREKKRMELEAEKAQQAMEEENNDFKPFKFDERGLPGADVAASDDKEGATPFPSLHEVLGREDGDSSRGDKQDDAQATTKSPPRVTEAHYSLDDRDSQRIDRFMKDLFPEERDSIDSEDVMVDLFPGLPQGPKGVSGDRLPSAHPAAGAGPSAIPPTIPMSGGPNTLGEEGDSDSDDWDDLDSLPNAPSVMRFDPVPKHAQSSNFWQDNRSYGSDSYSDTNDRHKPSLREGWARPPSSFDQVYDADDFASEADQASGLRRWAPPAPTVETAGKLMTEARRKYEREWATELESVEEVQRSNLTDVESRAARRDASMSKRATKGDKLAAAEAARDRKSSRPAYIAKGGLKVLSSGRASWRVVGRPPPRRYLKAVKEKDVAKQFNLSDRQKRKRNVGSGLSWTEAKSHWIQWFQKNKRNNINRVLEADSPKQKDVMADYEQRVNLSLRRHRPRGNWTRTGPGGAAMNNDDE